MTSRLHNSANGAESNSTLCFVEFARWRYRRRSFYLPGGVRYCTAECCGFVL